MATLSSKTIERASSLAEESILPSKDLLHLRGGRASIDNALSRLAGKKRLFRADRGIYVLSVSFVSRVAERAAHKKALKSRASQRGEVVAPDRASSARARGLTAEEPKRWLLRAQVCHLG